MDVVAWRAVLSKQDDLSGDCTAVTCYNNRTAIALEVLLAARGVQVPGDLSVVGCDDLHAHMGLPPLTTVSHMLVEMGSRATEVVLDVIDKPELCVEMASSAGYVASELIIRGSTGPAACALSV
jgi:LacI family transcriptional regulator